MLRFSFTISVTGTFSEQAQHSQFLLADRFVTVGHPRLFDFFQQIGKRFVWNFLPFCSAARFWQIGWSNFA